MKKRTKKTGKKTVVHHRKPTPQKPIHHRRKTSSGSTGAKGLIIDSLMLGAGAMLAGFVAGKLPLSPKIKSVAPLAMGLALTSLSKGNKTMQKLGQGMMVGGVLSGTKAFVPSLGLAGDDLSGNDQMLLGAIEMYKEQNLPVPVAPRAMGDEFAGENDLNGWVVN